MFVGWTALHAAAKNDHSAVASYLLEKGADRSARAAHRLFEKK